jgi:hypothetical protein
MVYTNGSNYYAKNGITGFVEFSGDDATSVIQYAIDRTNALGGGKVLLMKGIYIIRSTISVKSNVVVEGESSDVTVLSASSPDFGTVIDIDSQSNVAVRRLTIDKGGTSMRSDRWIYMGLSCENSNSVLIEDVVVRNTPNYAMVFGGRKDANIFDTPYAPCNNVVVRGCKIINSYKDGIHFFGGNDIVIEDNYFDTLVDDAIALGADVNYPVRNVIIRNNIVKNSAFRWTNGVKLQSGWNSTSTPGSNILSNIVVTGNIFVEVAQQGFTISHENSNYPVSDMAQNIIVENNILKSIYINSATNVVLRGNIVVKNISISPKAFYYTYTTGVSDVAVVGNFVGELINVPGYPGIESGVLQRISIIGNIAIKIDVGSPAKLVTIVGNSLFPGSDNNVRIAGLQTVPPENVVVAFNVADGGNIDWNNFIAGYEYGAKTANRVMFIGNIGVNARNYTVASNPNSNEIYMIFNNGNKPIYPGGNVKLMKNPIYVTENSGTAVIPASSTRVTVSHGLARAPTKVLITPLGPPQGKLWIENITATSFDIVTDIAPTNDLTIAWYAEV